MRQQGSVRVRERQRRREKTEIQELGKGSAELRDEEQAGDLCGDQGLSVHGWVLLLLQRLQLLRQDLQHLLASVMLVNFDVTLQC